MKTKSVSFAESPVVQYYNPKEPIIPTVNPPTIELNFAGSKLLSKNENTLPYVKLTLGSEPDSFNTVGLLDTGCSWSICEYKTFQSIPSYEKYIVEKISNTKISCANDSSLQVEYKARIPITFIDKDDKRYTFEKTFYIVRNLIHPIFLGYEIINNEIANAIFHDHLSLINPVDKSLVEIPIMRQLREPEINFSCIQDT